MTPRGLRVLLLGALAFVLSTFPGATQEDDPRIPGVSFEELQRRARDAMAAGQPEEALRYYRAGVALNPLWNEGWFSVGSLQYMRGRHDEARDAFQRIVDAAPAAGPAWALLGFSEFQLEEYDRAHAALSRGLSLGLDDGGEIESGVHHHLALLLIRSGDFEGSVQHLLWLARSQPPSPPVLDASGLMILRMPLLPSELDEPRKELVRTAGWAAYSTLAGRHEEARPLFEDLVARYPEAPGVHLAYGLFLSAQGDDGALAQLEKEVALHPDNARAHLEIAFQHLERGDAADALPSARESVRLASDVYSSHLALGRALAAGDAVSEGVAELEEARRLGPEIPEVYVALARAYAKQGRTADVEKARAKLRELDAERQPHKQ